MYLIVSYFNTLRLGSRRKNRGITLALSVVISVLLPRLDNVLGTWLKKGVYLKNRVTQAAAIAPGFLNQS
jgi:hypothetical protein